MNIEVAKLTLVNGKPYHTSSEMDHAEVRGGKLYVMVEVSAPMAEWDHVSRELVARVIETFAISQMDDSDALYEAATDINNYLLARNDILPKNKRIWAGVNAVFIRDNQLFLGQAGPALTYIIRDNLVTRYPNHATRRMPVPLGEQANLPCRLADFTLQPNDLISLTASHLPTQLSESIVHKAMQNETPNEIVSTLIELAGSEDFSAFVLQYEPTPKVASLAASINSNGHPTVPLPFSQTQPEHWAEEGTQSNGSAEEDSPVDGWADQDMAVDESDQRGYQKPYHASASQSAIYATHHTAQAHSEPINKQVSPPPSNSGSPPVAKQTADSTVVGTLKWINWQSLLRQLGIGVLALLSFLLGALGAIVGWLNNWFAPRMSKIVPALDPLAHMLSNGSTRIMQLSLHTFRQLLPGYQARPRRPKRPVRPPAGDGSDFLRVATISIPILLLLIGLTFWFLRADNNNTLINQDDTQTEAEPQQEQPQEMPDFATLVGDAQRRIIESPAVDQEIARKLLNEATGWLDQAQSLAVDETQRAQVLQLQQQAQLLLDQLDHVQRPSTMVIATLNPGSQPKKLLYGSNTLFVWEGDAIYRLDPNQRSTTPLQADSPLLKAQQPLPSSDSLVGNPKALTWVPVAGVRPYDALLLLTTDGQLIEYEPTLSQINTLPVSTFDIEVQASEGYHGNLYLLDRVQRQIWKYIPDQLGGYTNEALPWIAMTEQQNIGRPIDLAIDGAIFLLDESGQVRRFQRGELNSTFALDPVEPALMQAVAITKVPPKASDLFVADNERVIQFNSNGGLITQYRSPLGEGNSWGQIHDIAIHPESNALYVLGDNGIYFLDLNNPQPALAPQGSEESEGAQEVAPEEDLIQENEVPEEGTGN